MNKDVYTWQVLFGIFWKILKKNVQDEKIAHTHKYVNLYGKGRLWQRRADGFFFLTCPCTCCHHSLPGTQNLLAGPAESLLSGLLNSLPMAGADRGHHWDNSSVSPRLRKFLFHGLWGGTWARLLSYRPGCFPTGVVAGFIWTNSCLSPVAPCSTRS